MKNLLNLGVPVASSCGGDGICGRCKMEVSSNSTLPLKTELEQKTLDKNKANPKERLSCQLYVSHDVEVKTTYW